MPKHFFDVDSDATGKAIIDQSCKDLSLERKVDGNLRYYEVMNKNRETAVRYLTYGELYDQYEKVPAGMKKALDMLVASSNAGDLKATKEILNRVLGGILQNIHVDVSAKKLIHDDTEIVREAPIHVDSHVVEPRESRPDIIE